MPLGGTCVNVGCVPSKFFIRAAESVHKTSHSTFDAISPKGAEINFRKVVQQKNQLVAGMQQEKYLDLLNDLDFVKMIEGFAKFKGKNSIIVDGSEFKGQKIIIATGSATAIRRFMQ